MVRKKQVRKRRFGQDAEIPAALRNVLANLKKPEAKICNNESEILYLQQLRSLCRSSRIDQNRYINDLRLLLYIEEYYQEIAMKNYDLFNQRIQKYEKRKFLIHVPYIDDVRISLRKDDCIKLEAIDGSFGAVVQIENLDQKVALVTVSKKFANAYTEQHRFNISFLLHRYNIKCCHKAIHTAHDNELVKVAYPKIAPIYNELTTDLYWFDENIGRNAEQQQAVRNIVARTAHPAPYILFGPPGTGKTATLVEAVTQAWQIKSSNNILICTPSNAAGDEITKRLLRIIPHADIHRMYSATRKLEDIIDEIKPCANFERGSIVFLSKQEIMRKRIVVVTLMTCSRLLQRKLRESHFSYVFIDEAGQATEPEMLIPLGIISGSDDWHRGRLQAQVVIAGDPKQLGPTIASRITELLGKSMLERLMDECEPYKKNASGKYNPQYITKLIRNFRSDGQILKVPNELFYDNELIACGPVADIQRAYDFWRLPNKKVPIIFHSVNGNETREKTSPSVCNREEVPVIEDYLRSLIGKNLGGRVLEQKDIGIITPYTLQSKIIRAALDRNNWTNVDVGTVEIFQGQERDVIIMSTTRSRLYVHNGKEHIGFLSNPKRFNVTITRAKALLIVVGNGNILRFDPTWRAFLQYCKATRACRGASFSASLTTISAGERKKLLAPKHVLEREANPNFSFPKELPTSLRKEVKLLKKPEVLDTPRIDVANKSVAEITIDRCFKFCIEAQDVAKATSIAIPENAVRRKLKRSPRVENDPLTSTISKIESSVSLDGFELTNGTAVSDDDVAKESLVEIVIDRFFKFRIGAQDVAKTTSIAIPEHAVRRKSKWLPRVKDDLLTSTSSKRGSSVPLDGFALKNGIADDDDDARFDDQRVDVCGNIDSESENSQGVPDLGRIPIDEEVLIGERRLAILESGEMRKKESRDRKRRARIPRKRDTDNTILGSINSNEDPRLTANSRSVENLATREDFIEKSLTIEMTERSSPRSRNQEFETDSGIACVCDSVSWAVSGSQNGSSSPLSNLDDSPPLRSDDFGLEPSQHKFTSIDTTVSLSNDRVHRDLCY